MNVGYRTESRMIVFEVSITGRPRWARVGRDGNEETLPMAVHDIQISIGDDGTDEHVDVSLRGLQLRKDGRPRADARIVRELAGKRERWPEWLRHVVAEHTADVYLFAPSEGVAGQ